jgi:hypothetical protein
VRDRWDKGKLNIHKRQLHPFTSSVQLRYSDHCICLNHRATKKTGVVHVFRLDVVVLGNNLQVAAYSLLVGEF